MVYCSIPYAARLMPSNLLCHQIWSKLKIFLKPNRIQEIGTSKWKAELLRKAWFDHYIKDIKRRSPCQYTCTCISLIYNWHNLPLNLGEMLDIILFRIVSGRCYFKTFEFCFTWKIKWLLFTKYIYQAFHILLL